LLGVGNGANVIIDHYLIVSLLHASLACSVLLECVHYFVIRYPQPS